MKALLLAPHHDDETLFASYLCQQHRPHIVTVLRSVNQERLGITHEERVEESEAAAEILGCEYTALHAFPDDESWEPYEPGDTSQAIVSGPNLMWRAIRDILESMASGKASEFGSMETMSPPEVVFAPWPELGGHPQHNRLGELARDVFGDRVTFYTTYQYGGPRSVDVPVEPTREQVLGKLRALACYRSQILRGPYRFFTHALDEYTRAP